MAIDRMDWHYGGDFPDDLQEENGGTHIGIFLAWVINNDLVGELHVKESPQALEDVKNRRMTGRDFLINECDAKFWEEELDQEGLDFTESYYSEDYFDDYTEVLAEDLPTIYHVEDTWANYERMSALIDRRFAEWKRKKETA